MLGMALLQHSVQTERTILRNVTTVSNLHKQRAYKTLYQIVRGCVASVEAMSRDHKKVKNMDVCRYYPTASPTAPTGLQPHNKPNNNVFAAHPHSHALVHTGHRSAETSGWRRNNRLSNCQSVFNRKSFEITHHVDRKFLNLYLEGTDHHGSKTMPVSKTPVLVPVSYTHLTLPTNREV